MFAFLKTVVSEVQPCPSSPLPTFLVGELQGPPETALCVLPSNFHLEQREIHIVNLSHLWIQDFTLQ